jgi:hypothetical protein
MYKKQIIFVEIDKNTNSKEKTMVVSYSYNIMGSDIISHRIAIGLFYHKISIACKMMSFIHFRFSDILFSL